MLTITATARERLDMVEMNSSYNVKITCHL